MLLLAVPADGMICFQKYISTRDGKGKRLFGDAEEWVLMEQNGDWLFSFDNICEILGLNPGTTVRDCCAAGTTRMKLNG